MSLYKDHSIADNASDLSKYSMLAVYWALTTVVIVITIKAIAYFYSGSAALLGSLTDTIGDGLISLVTLLSVRISLMPADEDHRFGHGKVEGFSALLQASFLVGAAVFLLFESAQRFIRPVEIDHHFLAIGVSLVSVTLSMILVAVQSFVIKKTGSLAIEADQSIYINDVLVNGAVVIALGLHYTYGWAGVDAFFGVIIALYIGWTGFNIGSKAADMLMDKEIGDEQRSRIESIVMDNKNVHGMHDLRTRRVGMTVSISFDVELDGDLSLQDAHSISRDLEFALLAEFPNADIIIHKDPKGDTYDTRHKVQGVHH